MKDSKDGKTQDTAKYYCIFYLVTTVLFHVFLPVAPAVPFLAITGAHTPYFLIIFTMLLLEANVVSPGRVLGSAVIAGELLFLAALILVSVIAFWKKKYYPFWVLSVFSNSFTICAIILAFCLNGDAVVLPAFMLCSIIGNAIFGCLLYRKIHRPIEHQKQKAEAVCLT